MHGVALNVCPDLTGFERIVPCGIGDRAVGSLEELVPGLDVATVIPVFLAAFARVFDCVLEVERCDQLNCPDLLIEGVNL